jgi:exopolyphosphatase / guanosine-5'-triphosphate,3'-diphosphate pyrophosphatase
MPVFAAVDIGSNSVRLSIGEMRAGRVYVLHQDREVTRLGEGVFRNGSLDPGAVALTIKVLQRFRKACERFGAEQTQVVSTSAVRDAKNSRVFADLIRSTTGWRLRVITGLEEGRLIHLGLQSSGRFRAARKLLIDLGGGSCELTLSNQGHIQQMVSLPLGAVRLTQQFLHHDPPSGKELLRMNDFIDEELGRIEGAFSARGRLTIATSGTAAALVSAAEDVDEGDQATQKQIARLEKKLSKLKRTEREHIHGINPKRSEIIIAGAAVYSRIMSTLGVGSFRYSPLGLRDGILAQMAADYDARSRTHRQVESDRHDAVLELCKRYKVDLVNSKHVATLALRLFSQLKKLHELSAEYSEYISAAGMLLEVGSYINRTGRHRHAYYVIANSEIFGFSPEQRALIAVIARYQGGSTPQLSDRIVRALQPRLRHEALKAIAILRLARALNHGRRQAVRSARTRMTDSTVVLTLQKARTGAELEVWAAEKEADYFRDVFGRELVVANP